MHTDAVLAAGLGARTVSFVVNGSFPPEVQVWISDTKTAKGLSAEISLRPVKSNMERMQQLPEVRGEGLYPHSCLTGSLGSQLLSSQQTVEAVQDAGQTHRFPPQGGGDGVDGTQLRNKDLRNKE